ncbi:MAG: SH3 domain-containing protein [bacterium]|nr:SH3 domain-containing protein [bacterium]
MTKSPLALTLSVAMLTSLPGPAPAQELPDELKEKAVMITVNFRRGGAAEYGTGVLLCQENDRAWILTANHVFAGKSKEPWKQMRLSQIESATISFFRNYAPEIKADSSFLRKEMSFYTFKPDDLLLLSIPLTHKLPSTATLSPPPSEVEEPGVSSTGFWKDRGLSWGQAAGELAASRTGGTKFLYHTGEVHEGFSGGPLFNALGELIGINIQRVPGEQTSVGEAGAWFGKAQTLNNPDVLSVIDKWVPAKCLESASQLAELAFLIYKEAMQAVSTYNWTEAEDLLGDAIQQKPVEGGSVHLEGMRYTKYLPLYHLGLALYKQDRYSEAIGAWDRSESQGVIKDDKRYRSLKRLRNRAYEAIRRQQQAAVAAGEPTLEERGKAAFEQREAEQAAAEQAAAEQAAVEQAAAEKAAAEEEEEAKRAAAEQAAAEKAARQRIPTHRVAAKATPCLNLRAEPSLRGPRFGCLWPGTAVRRIGQQDDWSRVLLPGWLESWLEGWMASDYLQPVSVLEQPAAERRPSHRVIAVPCLILRRGPSRSSDRLDCLRPGSAVKLLYERRDWSRVLVRDGREGWMFSSYLEPVEAVKGH